MNTLLVFSFFVMFVRFGHLCTYNCRFSLLLCIPNVNTYNSSIYEYVFIHFLPRVGSYSICPELAPD